MATDIGDFIGTVKEAIDGVKEIESVGKVLKDKGKGDPGWIEDTSADAAAQVKDLLKLESQLDNVIRQGMNPGDYDDDRALTEFNKSTFTLASKAHYYSDLVKNAEKTVRDVTKNDQAILLAASVFDSGNLFGQLLKCADTFKELRGLLDDIEKKANAAIEKVNKDVAKRKKK